MKTSMIQAKAWVDSYQNAERNLRNASSSRFEEVINLLTLNLNGEKQEFVCDTQEYQHIPTTSPEVKELRVNILFEDGYIRNVDLCKEDEYEIYKNSLLVDGDATAESMANGIFKMLEDAILVNSDTFEDLEKGLHYCVGVVHHSKGLDKDVKRFLLKSLYKSLRGGSLRRLYSRLKDLQRKG